jgi:hypothetical protein
MAKIGQKFGLLLQLKKTAQRKQTPDLVTLLSVQVPFLAEDLKIVSLKTRHSILIFSSIMS